MNTLTQSFSNKIQEKLYWVKNPNWLKKCLPDVVWQMPQHEKTLFLTFDDGPIPQVTEWVLESLEQYRATATFFVVGDNVVKHPHIFEQVRRAGHAIGNHTFHHLNGWKTANSIYFDNIERCQKVAASSLFRPPYGKLTPSQYLFLKKQYRIVLWDVLSGDFDPSVSPQKCYENVVKNIENGSVVVLHDSRKAEKNLRFALPRILETCSQAGWRFEKLNFQTNFF